MMDKSFLGDKRNELYKQLITMLQLIQNFNKTQAMLQNSLEAIGTSERKLRVHEDILEEDEGDYLDDGEGNDSHRGIQDERRLDLKNLQGERNNIKTTVTIIKEIDASFNKTLQMFLKTLEKDLKLKSLSFKFDFNEFYKTMRGSGPSLGGAGGNSFRGSASGFGVSANLSGLSGARVAPGLKQPGMQLNMSDVLNSSKNEMERPPQQAPGYHYFPGAFQQNKQGRDGQ